MERARTIRRRRHVLLSCAFVLIRPRNIQWCVHHLHWIKQSVHVAQAAALDEISYLKRDTPCLVHRSMAAWRTAPTVQCCCHPLWKNWSMSMVIQIYCAAEQREFLHISNVKLYHDLWFLNLRFCFFIACFAGGSLDLRGHNF